MWTRKGKEGGRARPIVSERESRITYTDASARPRPAFSSPRRPLSPIYSPLALISHTSAQFIPRPTRAHRTSQSILSPPFTRRGTDDTIAVRPR